VYEFYRLFQWELGDDMGLKALVALCLSLACVTTMAQNVNDDIKAAENIKIETSAVKPADTADKNDDPSKTVINDGDTYNFYFQKNEKPEPEKQNEAKEAEKKQTVIQKPKRSWYNPFGASGKSGINLIIGKLASIEEVGGGSLLGVGFPISKKWSTQLEMFNYEGSINSEVYESQKDASGGSFAVGYSPFTFSKKIKMEFISGLMLVSEKKVFKGFNSGEFTKSGSQDLYVFAGIQGVGYLSQNWGLGAHFRLASFYSQIGINLIFRI
jgi:hypothetical protein